MEEYINGYQFYLESSSSDKLDVPPELEREFWKWFQENAQFFNEEKIKRNLISPFVFLKGGICFKNSFRVSNSIFTRRLYYFEGFAYREMDYSYLRHAFNVNELGEVFDYSLNKPWKNDKNQYYQIYLGVKIPLTFAKMVYKEKNSINSQYSLLASYFLHEIGFEKFLEYTSAS